MEKSESLFLPLFAPHFNQSGLSSQRQNLSSRTRMTGNTIRFNRIHPSSADHPISRGSSAGSGRNP
jgi:hypothetical protein